MTLWVVFAILFTAALLLSGAGAPEKAQPQQVYVIQASPREQQGESGCLPLLLFISAIVAAVALL